MNFKNTLFMKFAIRIELAKLKLLLDQLHYLQHTFTKNILTYSFYHDIT